MHRRRARVTLGDIARAAAVSKSTVCKALTGRGGNTRVSDVTAWRVRQVARELGYKPDGASGEADARKTGAVGVITPTLRSSFYNELMMALHRSLGRQGYRMSPWVTGVDARLERKTIQDLPQDSLDGAICLEYVWHNREVYRQLAQEMPFVARTWGKIHKDCRCPIVAVSYGRSVAELFDHLQSRGRTQVCLVGGRPKSEPVLDWRNPKLRLLRDEMATRSLPLRDDLWARIPTPIFAATPLSAGLYDATLTLLQSRPEVDALIVTSAELAAPVYRAAADAGRTIGGDLDVAAWGGPESTTHFRPELTTMDEPFPTVADALAKLLTQRIHAGAPISPAPQIIVPALLRLRASTGGVG